MADVHRWWMGDPQERFWLESTDRDDLGASLRAPQLNESGEDFWSYSLIREMPPGDVVLHYYKPEGAIVARSVVKGTAVPASIVWAARGTFARAKGTTAHERPGMQLEIEQFARLERAVTLDEIRQRIADLRGIVSEVKAKHGESVYFPFELGDKRETRPLQGYLFKLPRAFVELFPQLGDLPAAAPLTPLASDTDDPPQGPGRVEQTTYRWLRDTAKARSVKQAHKHLCQLCSTALVLADGTSYAEGHHIQPLGGEHRGPDVTENIICVCPNHHALLDYFAIAIDPAAIRSIPQHRIAERYIAYHNKMYRALSPGAA